MYVNSLQYYLNKGSDYLKAVFITLHGQFTSYKEPDMLRLRSYGGKLVLLHSCEIYSKSGCEGLWYSL